MCLNTSLLEDNFEIPLEFFHAIISIDTWGEEVHVQHVGNKLSRCLSTNTRSASHQQATTGLRESSFSERDKFKDVIE